MFKNLGCRFDGSFEGCNGIFIFGIFISLFWFFLVNGNCFFVSSVGI